MMKVLFLTNGGSNFDRIVLEELVERGYETWYVYLRSKGHAYQIPGVHSVYLGYEVTRSEGLLSFKLFHRLKAYWRFRKLLKEVKPDILQAGWVQGPGFMAAVSGYHPFVLMPWGSDILLFPQRNRLFHWMTTFTLKRADAIQCDAETVKQRIHELSDYEKDRVTVFPWGVDLEEFRRDSQRCQETREFLGWENRQIIAMTRTLDTVYGIEYFVRALPGVFERVPGARALLVAGGPLENSIRNLVADLDIENKVKFLGGVPNEEMANYLNAADLYVSSSLSDGTSVSLLEAMACGLPVVVTDLPTNREWVRDDINGAIVPAKNSEALEKAMVELLTDDSRARDMGEANVEVVRVRANWKQNFQKLDGVYHQLLSVREGPRVIG